MKRATDELDAVIGNRVRQRRMVLGLSQEKLAIGLGLTFQQVQKYETGHNRISCGRIVRIAALLDTPVSYFFDGLDNGASAAPVEVSGDAMRAALAFDKIADAKVRSNVMQFISALASDVVKS
jgi:transcriptional regulator with XRE-family HTH domain